MFHVIIINNCNEVNEGYQGRNSNRVASRSAHVTLTLIYPMN